MSPITEQTRLLLEKASQKQADITGRVVLDTLALMFEHFADTIDQVNLDENASFEARKGAEAIKQAIASSAREAAASWRNGGTTSRLDPWKRSQN